MNHLLKSILALLIISISVGCQTDESCNSTHSDSSTRLTISLEESRVTLGNKVGSTYASYWSEGDRIVVNGFVSEEISINADNKSIANFEVKKVLSTPYNITYPYNESSESSSVIFPAEQEYTEGSFAPNSTPMCGYAENTGTRIELKHLATILDYFCHLVEAHHFYI